MYRHRHIGNWAFLRFNFKPQPFSSQAQAPSIVVGLTESAGRGVFASRRIAAGELIHTAQPIVSHPSLSSLYTVCYFCLSKLPHLCNSPSFCTQQCHLQSHKFYDVEKKADWSTFNEYCRLQGLKYPLLVKRLACQVISGATPSNVLDILQPQTLSPNQVSEMKKEAALLRSTFEDSGITTEQMMFLTEEWYTGVLARFRTNSFRIELAMGNYEDLLSSAAASVEAEAAVGTAVYILPSLYNHDCGQWTQACLFSSPLISAKSPHASCFGIYTADPNVNIVWIQNVDAKIKALRDIEEGEELRICYIDVSMDFDARQRILYEGFGFHCNCSRCASKD